MSDQDDYQLEEYPNFEPEPDAALGNQDSGNMPDDVQASPANNEARYDLAKNVLRQVHDSIGHVIELLEGNDGALGATHLADLVTVKQQAARQVEDLSGARVVEGVFDGFSMIGSDGKSYSIPPNYSSKSRLVEGDVLKLTIMSNGRFIFKQIGPVERDRLVGRLAYDPTSACHVAICGSKTYKLLPASVTYFKGDTGDDVFLLVPKATNCVWAAVENVVKK